HADAKEGLKWYRKAAKTGNAAAEFGLALAYLHGTGVLQDSRQAAEWLQRAARHGSVAAAGLLNQSASEAEMASSPASPQTTESDLADSKQR
ncbi:MAG: hypothetical protein DMG99_03005, partial [Acidobacteria bacterium]